MIHAADPRVILLLAFCVLGVLIATVYLRSRRTSVWRRFARRYDLRYRETDGHPKVSGQLGHRDVELAVSESSSDTGILGVEVTEMNICLHGLPEGLKVEPTPGVLFDSLVTSLEERTLLTGNDEFDSRFRISGADDQQVKEYMTSRRQQCLMALADSFPGCDIEVSEGAARIRSRETGARHQQLDRRLIKLVQCAATLDGKSASVLA